MSPHSLLRVDRREGKRTRHYVVHGHSPKIVVEMEVEGADPGRPARGVIKRVCLPNSWAGCYDLCAPVLSAAERFFEDSLALEHAQ
jgi:hypothetical protein